MDAQGLPSDVLIVEDNFIIALDTEMVLQSLGVANVRTASTVAAAVAAIDARTPDFVLVDVDLGDDSGYDLAKILTRRGITFAFATGHMELKAPAAQLGAIGVIDKPYTTDGLRELLRRARR